jgi:hypothetical protein
MSGPRKEFGDQVAAIARQSRAFDPIGESCYGAPTLRRLRYLRAGAWALGGGPLLGRALAAVLCGLIGCGPARFISQVNDKAAGAVAAAKEAKADVLAPYEDTAAAEYLHKAREEGAYAEYQVAIEYGRRAEDLAVKARALAVERRTGGGGALGAPGVEPPVATRGSP